MVRSSLILCFLFYPTLAAYADSCDTAKVTETATVKGYSFQAREAQDPDDGACMRIYQNGQVIYQLDDAQKYFLGQPEDRDYGIPHIANGTDLTGTGRPDMIVVSWSGGAHCCNKHYVFELAPKFRLIIRVDDGDNDLAHFVKLADERSYFYVTRDIWAYWPGSYASSVSHKVILKWDGNNLVLDPEKLKWKAPSLEQWNAALRDADDALKDEGVYTREELGKTLWDTTLDLIYTGHSDLAWKFVSEVNPKALTGNNPSLSEFCSLLKNDEYWPILKATVSGMPKECAEAKPHRPAD